MNDDGLKLLALVTAAILGYLYAKGGARKALRQNLLRNLGEAADEDKEKIQREARDLSLSLSLTVLMPDCAAGATPLPGSWEMEMKKGEAAPYDGVLVPPDAYRYYQADSGLFVSCEEKFRAAMAACPADPEEGWFTPRQLTFALLGAFFGLYVSAEVRQ